MKVVTSDILAGACRQRHQWEHKGDSGRLLIIGGSRRYKGAPALAALAALRSGVDLVTVATTESAADVISSFSPNIITEPLEGDFLNTGNIPVLEKLAERADAVLIGNGLGRMSETADAVQEFLAYLKKPCVVDADALHHLSDTKHLLRKGWIVTPHTGEFYNLSGVKLQKRLQQRAKEASRLSREFGTTVLLKGYKDVIAEGIKIRINSTGNPFMTVGGTGDVLSGIAAAFLAMGMNAFDAASAAAYLCGRAGDVASEKYRQGLMATDVIDAIPSVLAEV